MNQNLRFFVRICPYLSIFVRMVVPYGSGYHWLLVPTFLKLNKKVWTKMYKRHEPHELC